MQERQNGEIKTTQRHANRRSSMQKPKEVLINLIKISSATKTLATRVFFVLIFITVNFFYLLPGLAAGPNIISYQGRLYDSDGRVLGDSGAIYYFRFSVWDATQGGQKLWPAGAPNIIPLEVAWGVFNARLGDAGQGFAPLDLKFTDDKYYLEIEVATSADFSDGEVLAPRQRIVPAAYAINAEQLDGYRASREPGSLTIPVLDEHGRLVLSASLPGIRTASGSPLTFQEDSDGDIQFFNSRNKITSGGDLMFDGQMLLGRFSLPPVALGEGSLYFDTTKKDVFLRADGNWLSLTAGGHGGGTSTLQSVYDFSASPAQIVTSDNKDLRIVLSDTAVDSNVLVDLRGSESTFQILKFGLPYLTAQNFKNRIQVGESGGSNDPTLLVLATKNTVGDPPCVNGAIYYNSWLKEFRVCENNEWQEIKTRERSFITLLTTPEGYRRHNPGSQYVDFFPGNPQATLLDFGGFKKIRLVARMMSDKFNGEVCLRVWNSADNQPLGDAACAAGAVPMTVTSEWMPVSLAGDKQIKLQIKENSSGNSPYIGLVAIELE